MGMLTQMIIPGARAFVNAGQGERAREFLAKLFADPAPEKTHAHGEKGLFCPQNMVQ
jgi:hypothetical protein